MTCEATVAVIAGHELLATDGCPSCSAGRTCLARNHGGNNHGSPEPSTGLFACRNDPPGDFVPQDEGKRTARRHTVERESDICVTNTAACNLHNKLFRTGIENRKFAKLQRSVGSVQPESIRSLNAGHHEPLPEAISEMRRAWRRISLESVTAITGLSDALTSRPVFSASCLFWKMFRRVCELNEHSGSIHHGSAIYTAVAILQDKMQVQVFKQLFKMLTQGNLDVKRFIFAPLLEITICPSSIACVLFRSNLLSARHCRGLQDLMQTHYCQPQELGAPSAHLGASLWVLNSRSGCSFFFSRCSKCLACLCSPRLRGVYERPTDWPQPLAASFWSFSFYCPQWLRSLLGSLWRDLAMDPPVAHCRRCIS